MKRRFATVCLALLGSVACSGSEQQATQLLVSVEADPALRAELRDVRAFLYDLAQLDEAKPAEQRSFPVDPAAGTSGAQLFSFGIVRGGSDRFRLVVKGYASSDLTAAALVERKLIVSFRAGETVPVTVFLGQLCAGRAQACSGLGRSCAPLASDVVAAGECGPVSSLDDRGASATVVSSAPSDAGMDGRVLDPSGADGGLPDGSLQTDVDGSGAISEGGVDALPAEAGTDAQLGPAPTGECAGVNLCTLAAYPCVASESVGYTCQGQFADWPMPDATPGAKVAPSYELWSLIEAVTDNVTGLSWQRSLPDVYDGCTGTQAVAGDSCTLQEAKAYCAQLSIEGGQWRLPSKIELESILDETRSPAIAVDVFLGARSEMEFWTASPVIRVDLGHWSIDFADGTAKTSDPDDMLRVRCVRSRVARAARPQDRYVVDEQRDAVHDTFTGLTWQRTVLASDTTSEAARSYCAGLEGGGEGWRVPAYKELLTLVDPTRANPALDPVFPAVPDSMLFRSISASPTGTSSDLLVSPFLGASHTQADVDLLIRASAIGRVTYHVRCVR